MAAKLVLVDFEFRQSEGGTPVPVCLVAKELPSGEIRRVRFDESRNQNFPFDLGPDVIYVAYNASAELNCHRALNWDLPHHVLDPYAEFCRITSGRKTPAGRGLLGALAYFGLHGISAAEKHDMRDLITRGTSYSEQEWRDILGYCESDVVALEKLMEVMNLQGDLPQALMRGRYMKAASAVETIGVPIDVASLEKIRESWGGIKQGMIEELDSKFGVYEGHSFNSKRFENFLARERIRWPRQENGKLDLNRETFRTMVDAHPQLRGLYDLRVSLSSLRLEKLTVGSCGRNRYHVGAFGSKTGRNQPRSSRSVFGPSRWIRHLIKPPAGMALAYIDWSQQEFGIAAALSGDRNMMDAYRSGDPYLHFAKIASAVPANATKSSHPQERSRFKIAALGVLMGIGASSLGRQAGADEATGRVLLIKHQQAFPRFWEWSRDQVNRAMLGESLRTVFGWELHPGELNGPNTYRNFKLQANGAEMLRLAATAITEREIRLCALIHDAVLIEAPTNEIDATAETVRALMADASAAVLRGFRLNSDLEIIRSPDRFSEKGGEKMWGLVAKLAGVENP